MWSDKAKAGGGGSIEGEIVDYTFMDTFPFGDGDNDSKDSDSIYMLLVLRKDGVDEGDEENYDKRSLYLGSGQFLTIEEDGKVLKSSDDDGTPRLYDGGEVFKFIVSLEEAGFPGDARFPDLNEEKVIDFRPMIGTRIRLANEVDKESQLAIGKKALEKKKKGSSANASEEEIMEAGKRLVTKGKHKGKKFNRTYSKVTKVLSIPDEDDNKAKAKAGAKAGSKVAKGRASKATAADEDDDASNDDDDEEESSLTNKQADKLLLAVLKKKGKNGSIEKSALPLAITRYIAETKGDTDDRDALRKLVADEDWLTECADRGTIEFDASSKKQVVTAA